ncbi:hypothetical protein LTR66_003287 [Elasticomyces elasticus]|nr:hypothetical protein LTR66_003287 [Elasticomyces elasticus]
MSSDTQRGRGGASRGRGRGDRGAHGGPRGDGTIGRGGRGGSYDRGSVRGGRGGSSDGGSSRGGRGEYGAQRGIPDRSRGSIPAFDRPSSPLAAENIPAGIYMENSFEQPDPMVTARENAVVQTTRGKLIEGLPGRPEYAKLATKHIVLRANYYHVQTAYEAKQPQVPLYRYNVSVDGEQLSKPKRRRMMEMLMGHSKFDGVHVASDYSKLIVTTKDIDLGPTRVWTSSVEIVNPEDPPHPPAQPSDSQQVEDSRKRRTKGFKVECTGVFSLQDIMQYMQSNSAGGFYEAKNDVIQLLNIIMYKAPNTENRVHSIMGNKFYATLGHPQMESFQLGGGLEALRGYYSSVRTSTNRILVNLNVSSAAFFRPVKLEKLIDEFLGTGWANKVGDWPKIHSFLKMLKVRTEYLKTKDSAGETVPKPRTYTIVGLAPKQKESEKKGSEKTVPGKQGDLPSYCNAHEAKFDFTEDNKKRTISVFEYFKSHHNITLSRPQQPVLNVGTENDPRYVPIELCKEVLPGQPARRMLSGSQTSEMIRFAARAPNLNALSIQGTQRQPGKALDMFKLAVSQQAASLQPFGIRVRAEMLTVPGRILASPQLQYGQAKVVPRFGSWNLKESRFEFPGQFKAWSCFIIKQKGERYPFETDPRRLTNRNGETMELPDSLIGSFKRSMQNYGITMGTFHNSKEIEIHSSKEMDYRANTNKVLESEFAAAASRGIDVLLVILPEADRWLYSRIKLYGDVKHGIHTVNAVGSKIQRVKNQGMYFGNLALKFNIKGGGCNHTIPASSMSPLDNKTMLVGIDVTHPSPGSAKDSPSIAGMVANVDARLAQWPASIRTQTGRQEMVDDIAGMFKERLALWMQRNRGAKPNKVIVYRDGISEGQYHQVLEKELPGFQQAFSDVYGGEAHPKISIIVVGKRHHTRFYPTKREDADQRSFNPLPGTVVDRGVTMERGWDFYLQAHQGLQGTARPAHYVVIKDGIGFGADQLEQFTHKMCYLFNRATKAVSICPPAYYADLLCDRGRAYLFSKLNENQSGSDNGRPSALEWTGGVHRNIKDSTFYI